VNLSYLAGLALLAGAGLATQFELYPLAVLAFAGLYLLQNVRRPLMVGYLAEVIDPRLMASGLSVESQLKTVVLAGLAPAVGALADQFGVGLALAMVAGAGMLLTPLLQVRERK